MFPKNAVSPSYYELYLNPETRVDLFDAINPSNVVALRFSGEIIAKTKESDTAASRMAMPALRGVILHGTMGNYFDRHSIDDWFPAARIESFQYALGHRLGFEIRNRHVESLATHHGSTLRKLVLLGCSRLSSSVLTQCLESLSVLEYFALHLVTVDELRSNFLRALPPSLAVLKLQVINAWYAVALLAEERELCHTIESGVLHRDKPLDMVAVCFRDRLLAEDGRHDRWKQVAVNRHFILQIGPWEHLMVENM